MLGDDRSINLANLGGGSNSNPQTCGGYTFLMLMPNTLHAPYLAPPFQERIRVRGFTPSITIISHLPYDPLSKVKFHKMRALLAPFEALRVINAPQRESLCSTPSTDISAHCVAMPLHKGLAQA
ncbi:Uncharacterized protein Fot_49551 [Forsythia ovata]|uniref:Uncharacterized protein n=1 Tax=Forsythia ovata TaxID=205694 RepID=A0ABD1QC95_9LAMI